MNGTIWKLRKGGIDTEIAGEYLLIIEENNEFSDEKGFDFLSTAWSGLCWINANFLQQNYKQQ